MRNTASLFATCFIRTMIFITKNGGQARLKTLSIQLFRIPFEYQTSIRTAESETVRKHVLHFHVARDIRDVIQVALRIWKIVIDRRRQLLFVDSFRREYSFYSARCPESMPGHRFGGANCQPVFRVIPEDFFNSKSLEFIV